MKYASLETLKKALAEGTAAKVPQGLRLIGETPSPFDGNWNELHTYPEIVIPITGKLTMDEISNPDVQKRLGGGRFIFGLEIPKSKATGNNSVALLRNAEQVFSAIEKTQIREISVHYLERTTDTGRTVYTVTITEAFERELLEMASETSEKPAQAEA